MESPQPPPKLQLVSCAKTVLGKIGHYIVCNLMIDEIISFRIRKNRNSSEVPSCFVPCLRPD